LAIIGHYSCFSSPENNPYLTPPLNPSAARTPPVLPPLRLCFIGALPHTSLHTLSVRRAPLGTITPATAFALCNDHGAQTYCSRYHCVGHSKQSLPSPLPPFFTLEKQKIPRTLSSVTPLPPQRFHLAHTTHFAPHYQRLASPPSPFVQQPGACPVGFPPVDTTRY